MKPTDRDALARTSFLKDASREIAERLAIGAFVQTLPKGTLLFEQGQDAEFLHVLLEGRCGLIGLRGDGEECVVEIMHAGDCFILPAILLEAPYLMGARVLESSRVAMIPAETLRRALAVEPQLMRAASLQLARHWRVLVRQIKDLKLRSTSERVGAHLSALCDGAGHGRAVLKIEDEFRAIAARLGMTPESWSRSLKQLEAIGVRAKGHRIEIDDIARLKEFSRFDGLR
jgi:CRP/FNR family transcriptional regulator, transcriptional activator FtrB